MLLREIRERGYEGGISILKDWLASVRPTPTVPEIRRFETEPGYQAQIDWTTIRRGKDRLSAFVTTLGFSRWSYVWFTTDERFETLIDAHERFFDAIGGVPRTILYDNMKTVLIDRDAYPCRHCEDQVEVADGQQLGLAGRQPIPCRAGLALGAQD